MPGNTLDKSQLHGLEKEQNNLNLDEKQLESAKNAIENSMDLLSADEKMKVIENLEGEALDDQEKTNPAVVDMLKKLKYSLPSQNEINMISGSNIYASLPDSMSASITDGLLSLNQEGTENFLDISGFLEGSENNDGGFNFMQSEIVGKGGTIYTATLSPNANKFDLVVNKKGPELTDTDTGIDDSPPILIEKGGIAIDKTVANVDLDEVVVRAIKTEKIGIGNSKYNILKQKIDNPTPESLYDMQGNDLSISITPTEKFVGIDLETDEVLRENDFSVQFIKHAGQLYRLNKNEENASGIYGSQYRLVDSNITMREKPARIDDDIIEAPIEGNTVAHRTADYMSTLIRDLSPRTIPGPYKEGLSKQEFPSYEEVLTETEKVSRYTENFFGENPKHLWIQVGEQLLAIDTLQAEKKEVPYISLMEKLGIESNDNGIYTTQKPESLKALVANGDLNAVSMSDLMGKIGGYESNLTILDKNTASLGSDMEQYELLKHVLGIEINEEGSTKAERKLSKGIRMQRNISSGLGVGNAVEKLFNRNDFLTENQAERVLEKSNKDAIKKNDRVARKQARNSEIDNIENSDVQQNIYESFEDAVGATAKIENGLMVYTPSDADSLFTKFSYNNKKGDTQTMYIRNEDRGGIENSIISTLSRKGEKAEIEKNEKETKDLQINKDLLSLENINVNINTLQNTKLVTKEDSNDVHFETSYLEGKRSGRSKIEWSMNDDNNITIQIGKDNFDIDTSSIDAGTAIKNTTSFINTFQELWSDYKAMGNKLGKKEREHDINIKKEQVTSLLKYKTPLITGDWSKMEGIQTGSIAGTPIDTSSKYTIQDFFIDADGILKWDIPTEKN